MAQADLNVANQSGAGFRADLNNQLLALGTLQSGASAPSTTYAYMLWADTANDLFKIRNAANSTWVSLGTLSAVNLGHLALTGGTLTGALLADDAGTAALPAIAFDGDPDTGVFRKGANQLGISTAGIERGYYDASGWNGPVVGAVTATSINGGQLAGMRNRIINGALAIDQRNAGAAQTFTAGAALAYSVDRWYGYCTGANVTGQRVTGATAGQYRYQFTGAASVTGIGFGQRIEQLNSTDLANTTATLSVDLANSLLTTVTWTAYYATTADTFGTLTSPTRTQIATGTFTVTSTVTRYNTNISIPAAATTGIEIVFTVGAQTSGTWTIGNVQLEAGSVATPFERRSYGQELSLCQRYFEKSYATDAAVGAATGDTLGALTNVAINAADFYSYGAFRFTQTKRAIPTVTMYNPVTGASGGYRGVSDSTNNVATGVFALIGHTGVGRTYANSNNMTTNYVYAFHYAASAEL
mgnify:FL=1